MMNLALLPDWNSLDSVRSAHSNLEGAALVFFALLVVFDVLAHFAEDHKERARLLEKIGLCCFAVAVLCEIVGYRYGQRNDALSDQKIRSLDAVAHDADITATGAKTTADGAKAKADAVGVEADDIMNQLGNADERLRQLQIFALARHIGDPEGFVRAMEPFKGRQVLLRSYVGDAEGWLLCVSLVDAVTKVRMNITNQCGQWPFDAGRPITGLQISGPDSEAIAEALVEKGRVTGGAAATDGAVPLMIFSGIKNPFWLPESALARRPQQKIRSKHRAKP